MEVSRRRFEGAYRLHLQGPIPTIYEHESMWQACAVLYHIS
jgi:hypothetical protein